MHAAMTLLVNDCWHATDLCSSLVAESVHLLHPQLTSSTDNTNKGQDEIDFEFVNGVNGRPTDTPGSVWTNFWVNGKSLRTQLFRPAGLKVGAWQASRAWHGSA
jgi:hypothetical protein